MIQDSLFELDRFERIIAAWQANHPAYLAMARALGVEIARERGTVCMDDLLERMDELAIPKPDKIADARFAGSILRGCRDLKYYDVVMSRRANRRKAGVGGGMIAVYALKDQAA